MVAHVQRSLEWRSLPVWFKSRFLALIITFDSTDSTQIHNHQTVSGNVRNVLILHGFAKHAGKGPQFELVMFHFVRSRVKSTKAKTSNHIIRVGKFAFKVFYIYLEIILMSYIYPHYD
jgi:hypothetical protein